MHDEGNDFMKNLILLVSIFVLINLTACQELKNSDLPNHTANISSGIVSNTPDITSSNSNIIKKETPDATISSININKTVGLDDYIKTIKPKEYEVTQLLQSDIDNDKNIEIIVSFGIKGTGSEKFIKNFLLRKQENEYTTIGELKGNVASISDIKLIKLDSSNKMYIFGTQTNDAQGIGDIVYSLKGNEIIVVDKRFPATGKGVYTLTTDNNEIFRRVDYQNYNDIQKHKTSIFYTWDGNSFTKGQKEINYPYNEGNKFIYPKKLEDVIQCYLEATYLTAPAEIKELIIDDSVKSFNILSYYGQNGGFEYGLNLKHETITKGENEILIKTTDSVSNKYAYFRLVYLNGVWRIKEILSNL